MSSVWFRCRRLLASTCLASTLASCASTSVVDSWSDPLYVGVPVEKVLIIGLTEDERNRRIFENELATRIAALDIAVVQSMDLVPDLKSLDQSRLDPVIAESGADRVLITRVVSVEKERYYTPGTTYTQSYGYRPRDYHRNFDTFYNRAWETVYTPGYITDYTIARLETNLYDPNEDKLIWSVVSESYDPQAVTRTVQDLADLILADLKKNGLMHAP